jgi:hypothetical protein
MRPRSTASLALALAFLLAPPVPARAVILELNAGPRVSGFLVREDEREIVIRRVLDGREVEQAYPKADVALILRAVDPERLATLRPDQPRAYRDYAEELAEKREDPEARELALRLFHVAAVLDPEGLGRGSLLGMSTLADSPEQERRYRALAYLIDPKHDRGVLQPVASSGSRARSELGRRAFASALQAYRTQQTARAASLAGEPGVKERFDESPGLPSFDEFVKLCKDHPECGRCDAEGRVKCPECRGSGKLVPDANARNLDLDGGNRCPDCDGWGSIPCPDCGGKKAGVALTDAQLAAFLRAELAAESPADAPAPAAPGTDAGPGWAAALRAGSRPAPLLSLRHLTRFDPTCSVYRDGRWVRPDAK